MRGKVLFESKKQVAILTVITLSLSTQSIANEYQSIKSLCKSSVNRNECIKKFQRLPPIGTVKSKSNSPISIDVVPFTKARKKCIRGECVNLKSKSRNKQRYKNIRVNVNKDWESILDY